MTTWYPLLGFAALSVFVQTVSAALSIPGLKIQPWITWALSVFSFLLMLVAGLYATRGTWIEDCFFWVIGLHWVVQLIIGLGVLWLVGQIILGAIPDQWSSVALSSGLILVAFILPLWAQHALPPGKIADSAATLISSTSQTADDMTAGWFG